MIRWFKLRGSLHIPMYGLRLQIRRGGHVASCRRSRDVRRAGEKKKSDQPGALRGESVGNEAPIPCQQPPLRSAVHAWPNPSTQLGWKDCAVLLHSPKAERHSFTNQNPLSTTAHHPQSGATFEGLHGVSSFFCQSLPHAVKRNLNGWTSFEI